MITRADFSSLTGHLDEVFNEAASAKIAESVGFTIFDTQVFTEWTYDYLAVHGLGGAVYVADGQEIPTSTSDQGYTASYSHSYYGTIVAVTDRMRTFDLYGVIDSLVRNKIDTVFDQIDQSLADVLLYGLTKPVHTKPVLIKGENLKTAFKRFMTTLNKVIIHQLQRLTERDGFIPYAIVRTA
ncbi:MAG: hypothetical protein ACOZAL_01070 [Patescibacteria group bacterium]